MIQIRDKTKAVNGDGEIKLTLQNFEVQDLEDIFQYSLKYVDQGLIQINKVSVRKGENSVLALLVYIVKKALAHNFIEGVIDYLKSKINGENRKGTRQDDNPIIELMKYFVETGIRTTKDHLVAKMKIEVGDLVVTIENGEYKLEETRKICKHCNTVNDGDAIYCKHCGAKLE